MRVLSADTANAHLSTRGQCFTNFHFPLPPPYPNTSKGQYLPSNDIPCVFRETEEEGAEKILMAPINV